MTLILETQRLVIKAPSLSDINKWHALHSESEVTLFSKNTIQEWLDYDIMHYKKHGFSMGSVFEKNSNEFIGRAGLVYLLNDDTQQDIEIGYALHKTYWKNGYATELVKALIDWG